jgi:hypothetical protein
LREEGLNFGLEVSSDPDNNCFNASWHIHNDIISTFSSSSNVEGLVS